MTNQWESTEKNMRENKAGSPRWSHKIIVWKYTVSFHAKNQQLENTKICNL